MPPGEFMELSYEDSTISQFQDEAFHDNTISMESMCFNTLWSEQDSLSEYLIFDKPRNDNFIGNTTRDLGTSTYADSINLLLMDDITKSTDDRFHNYTDFSSDSGFSVLGVDLDLYNNNNDVLDIDSFINQDLDSLINETVNDLGLKDLNSKFEEIFESDTYDYLTNDSIEVEKEINIQPPDKIKIFNMFPHITDERNRRRRALLYESNYNPSKLKDNTDKEVRRQCNKKHDPLLNHDYTQKKCDDEKYFPCPISNCEKIYAKSSHLKAHLRRHSGEKPFACNWINCTWKFSRSDELARHKRSHSGIKPYKCEMCEKAFARSDHLSKHRKVHKKKMALYGSHYIKKRVKYN